MHKRKIRKHQSGIANFLVTTSSLGGSGEIFHDTMRKTMTQSLNKQLPTVTQKYAQPTVVDPRTSYPQKFTKRNISLNFRDTTSQRRTFDDRQESYKNDIQQTKPILFDNKEKENQKLKDVQKLLRRKYANRNKMFNIFNGWDGEPKGYINHQNLRSVLKLMGVNLTEDQSKQFIRMHSPNEDKLNLNSFLNIIYSSENQQRQTKRDTFQSSLSDEKFHVNFDEEQKDCRNVKPQNINELDIFQLQKALFQGQKIKNRLQKYLSSPEDAKQYLFSGTTSESISFQNARSAIISYLRQKQGSVKWRQLQGFLSLFQYNHKKQLSQETFCKAIFDNQITYQKQFIHKPSPPINLDNRLVKSSYFDSTQHVNIQNCLKKIDQSVFKASISYEHAFQKFDKDKDGFVSENDFVETMKQQNLLSQQQSKQVFDYLGGNNGKYQKCLTFKQFIGQVKPGMGTQENDQYPNFLRPKRVNQFRNLQRTTRSQFFDPLSLTNIGKHFQNLDQRKTRFSGTPSYGYSTLGSDGTKFWGKGGDLNAKVQFQKQQKQKIQNIQRHRLQQRSANRLADEKRREAASQHQNIKQHFRLQKIAQLKGAYQRANHRY